MTNIITCVIGVTNEKIFINGVFFFNP